MKNEEGKKGMIFWEPKTEAEKKLLELYALEEDDIRDHSRNRSHGDRKGTRPGQKFSKGDRMCEGKV